MLLRSSSSPILNSWLFPPDPQVAGPVETSVVASQLNRTRSVAHLPDPPSPPLVSLSLSSSSTSSLYPDSSPPSNAPPQAGGHHDFCAAARSKSKSKGVLPTVGWASSEDDLSDFPSLFSAVPAADLRRWNDNRITSLEEQRGSDVEEEGGPQNGQEGQPDEIEDEQGATVGAASAWPPLERILSTSGLDTSLLLLHAVCGDAAGVEGGDRACSTLVLGGDGWCGDSGGRVCGGGGDGSGNSGRGDDGGCGSPDGGGGHHGDGTDAYYLKMIEAEPRNSLLLINYAKYLCDVRGEPAKAYEYCGRAILANPDDADALSLYGDLLWRLLGDGQRSEAYFDRAVQAAPGNSYVLAAYARFLWDAEEEEEEEDDENQLVKEKGRPEVSPHPPFFHGAPPLPPPSSIAAAS